ncbi:MAG: bifunctional phosphoglucose/phosphomannose isomerase, partial [Bacteroidota bacterium]
QLEAAIVLGKQAKLTPSKQPIHHVVVSGMGGSGLGGVLVKQCVVDQLLVPMEISHNYTLPAYVNEHTLLIISSYSGDTEETLQAFQAGMQKQAKVICITSGGALKTLAKQYGIDFIRLPAGRPPRACLGYAVVQLLFVLRFYQLISWDFVTELQDAIHLLEQSQAALQVEAQQVAVRLQGKLPVIYTTAAYEAVALRLRQQLNENSKQLCWHHVIPALNHNEIVGWSMPHEHLAVLMLSSGAAHDRVQVQQRITQEIIQKHTSSVTTLQARGETSLIRSLYLIHLGDWISFYLAKENGVDPMEVAAIDRVKARLNAFS